MDFLGFLAPIFGFIMEWIYKFVPNYGWTLIIFTILTRILMFPLSIKQQKSMAKTSAYQPMMQEIQKKWANDKKRQQEEMVKFQQESGMSMTAGCLPMVANMLAIFGIIQVVYRPMQYILLVSTDVIAKAIEVANAAGAGLVANNFIVQNTLINLVKANPSAYADVLGDKLAAVEKFNFMFMGMDMSVMPELGFNLTIIIPILSVLTMVLSQVITMSMSGQQMQGSMKIMMWAMPVMFAFFAFTVPVGFSLYYTVSNILMFVQSLVLKKMFNPEDIKKQIIADLEEKRAAKKQKKEIIIENEDGTVQKKAVSDAELARIRLAKARALDEERYN